MVLISCSGNYKPPVGNSLIYREVYSTVEESTKRCEEAGKNLNMVIEASGCTIKYNKNMYRIITDQSSCLNIHEYKHTLDMDWHKKGWTDC